MLSVLSSQPPLAMPAVWWRRCNHGVQKVSHTRHSDHTLDKEQQEQNDREKSMVAKAWMRTKQNAKYLYLRHGEMW